MAAILETGNHIAHISDGGQRYDRARKFTEIIKMGIHSDGNWNVVPEIPPAVLEKIMEQFPNHAIAETGLGDLSIIEQFNDYWEKRQPIGRMRIWSYDAHLSGYEREGGLSRRRDR